MLMRNEDFMQGVGDEIVGEKSPLLKRAEEHLWLQKVGMSHLTMEEFIKQAEEESREFRRGLKEAMMEEGVEEVVVDGMFKEAEEILEGMMRGEMEKSATWWTPLVERGLGQGLKAIGNQALRAVKAPVLEAVAKQRGFSAGSHLLENLAPGAVKMGPLQAGQQLVLPEVQRGTLRMGVGQMMENIPGLKNLGTKMQNWGERAARNQATRLNSDELVRNLNNSTKSMVQEARNVGGVSGKTMKQMEELKNMTPGPANDVPGAVPASVVNKVQSTAERNLANPGVGAKMMSAPNTSHFMPRFTPGKGLGRGLWGAGLGTMAAGPVGGLLGGVGGMATGTFGTVPTALATGAAGLYGAKKLLGSGGDGSSGGKLDETGLPSDRHRMLPFMGNNWTGAMGGALLAAIIARQMGISGPLGWLLPLLGGVAGYKMLPGMINSWSDRPGTGVNAVPEIQRQGNAETFGYQPGA